MAGVLMAPPTTALYDRMKKEGRLIETSEATSNFSPPNFRTILPLPVILSGLSSLLTGLYEPDSFFQRAFRSLQAWRPRGQQPPRLPMSYNARVFFASVWTQGIRSDYRRAYWRFLWLMARNWARQPAKIWLGFMVLLSAHHFVIYARQVTRELEETCRALAEQTPSALMPPEEARVG
jgi:hypothetical protein